MAMAYRKEARTVDQYVQKLEKTVRSEQEKCLQGLNIAKMYYEAGEMEESLKYVNKYISVQDRDYRALKLLGHIYSTTGHHIKAVNYYKRSLELRGDQHDVIMRVGELYCTIKKGVEPANIKEWLYRVENIDPTHPMVFKLKERLLPANVTDGHFNALQDITRNQLALGIDDEDLHIKLVTSYVNSGLLVDAVIYCQSVNENSVMFGNIKWQLFCLDLYQHYYDGAGVQDVKVLISMLQCMDILLNHMMETKQSESTTASLLIRFDISLQHMIQSDGLVDSDITQLVDELCGTLYCHCGKYLLSQHSELSLGLACVTAALSVMVPNIHQLHLPPHLIHYWEQATYRRISQCGHIIKFVENNYGYLSTSKVTTAMVVNAVYKGKKCDPAKSFIMSEDRFVQLQLQMPSEEELLFCDCEVIGNDPFNISFLLWITICRAEMGTHFLVLCIQQLFPHMKTNTNKLSSRCDVDTLCHFDMEALLILLLDKLKSGVLKGADGMKLMISSFLGSLPIETRYAKFWKNALKLSNRKSSIHDGITVKEEMQRMIAEVRGFKPVRLSTRQLGTLAQHFKKRAEDILECDDSDNVRRLVEALFVNSCHYWKLVIETVREKSYSPFRHTSQRSKMNNSGTGMILYSQLIDRSDHTTASDNDSLLDDAFISLGTAALYCKDTNTALLNYGHVKGPQGPYQQCKIYLMMSEKCRVDEPHKSYGLLEKANSCIEQAMQRIAGDDDDDSGLMEELVEIQKDIKSKIDELKGVNDSEFYDEFMPFLKSDPEPPLVHSTPATMSSDIVERSIVTRQQPQLTNDHTTIISAMQKQITELQNQVALLQQQNSSSDGSLSKVTTTPSMTRDHDATRDYDTTTTTTSGLFLHSDSYQSPHGVSYASQYDNEMPVSFVSSQSVVASSFANSSLSSLNFGLAQDDNNGLLSGGLSSASANVTTPLVITNTQSSTVSYATSFPISTSSYSTTSIGMNLPSFNGNFLKTNFSGVGENFPSSTLMSFPQTITSSSAIPSSTLSLGYLGSNPNSATPSFSSSFPAGVNLFQAPSSSSTAPLLLGNTSSSVNTTSSTSFNLFSNFTSTSSTTEDVASYSTGTSLFVTSTSGLSFQVNPSLLQSTPLSFSIANSTLPASTVASGLFQHFPSSLKTTTSTTTSTLFNATTLSLGVSSQLSSNDKVPAGKQDEVEALNESQPLDDGYTPLVKLTDSYEVKSGEEDEKELFGNRGKLYRYDQPTKAWKERGIGVIKILQHNVSGKIRVLMRREHIFKICCNHYITGEMELTPVVGSNSSWTWTTLSDFSDEEAKVEKLCIRFKLFEVAQNFKAIFTDCVEKVKGIKKSTFKCNIDPGDLSVKFAPKPGSWECNDCSVFNEGHVTQCVTCGSINPNSTVTSAASVDSLSLQGSGTTGIKKSTFKCNTDPGDLSVKFAPKPGSWECNDCSVFNEGHVTQCVACGSISPNSTVTYAASVDSLSLQGSGTTFPTSSGSATFGSFKLGSTMLSVVNQPASMPPVETIQSSTITAVDNGESEHSSYEDEEETEEEEEDEEGSDVDIDHEVVVSSQTTASNLAAKFARKPGDWECNFCFVSNEKDIAQCIACGNINPNITTAPISSTATNVSSSFTSGVKLPVSLPAGQASQPVSTAVGFSLGGIKLGSLNVDTSTASSSGSIFKLQATLPTTTTQVSQSTSAVAAFKLGNQSSGGFKLGGLNISALSNKPSPTAAMQSSDVPTTTTQVSQSTSAVAAFKLGNQSSGGFKLGGLNISALSNKPSPTAAMQSSDDCIVTGELTPSEDEVMLAQRYMLPPTFYNYNTKPPCPGCRGCEDDSSDVSTTTDGDILPTVVTSSTLTTTAPVLFGVSSGGLQSFASLAKTTEFQFGLGKDVKGFAGAGRMLFQTQKENSEEAVNPEAEVDVDFKPLVSLPDTYQLTTGQECEDQLFCERAKLFRFDPNTKQWKERGIGNMTIMKNRQSRKSRLVMRREQVLKLCCNHVILPEMEFNPMSEGGNAWRWFTPCDFSDEEPKPEQLAIRFKKKEQADSFREVVSKCMQESATISAGMVDKDTSSSEEQQFSADIKLYQFQFECKAWERKGDGKVMIIKTLGGLQVLRVVDTSNCVFYEETLSTSCKLTQLPAEEKSWTWSHVMSSTSEVIRYAMRFLELSDSDQFEQLVCEHIVTIVPHSPRSPEIPPLSPASSSGGSPYKGRGRPLIEAIKSIGIWCCENCNTKNPGSESECLVCSAARPSQSLLSPPGMQNDNPFFSQGKPVDYNVSSLSSNVFALNNGTATGSDSSRNYTPFSIALLQHQQDSNKSDGPPSLVSVPSQEGDSEISAGQRQQMTRPLFQMPTFTISSETKPPFPLLDSTGSDNLTAAQADSSSEHPETEANIYFDPVVSLPSEFDNKSGEENEECVFTHRAKLYRYDSQGKMWKDRGIGSIKILRHKTSNKGRILMRREQVLKLCCNHYIVSGMTLKPGSYPDRSWIWFTSADYSEEVAQPEMLCVKFKDPEIARDFKNTFNSFATNAHSGTPVKPIDRSSEPCQDDEVVFIREELPEQELINLAQHYMLPQTFFNYLTKPPCPGCIGCDDEEAESEGITETFVAPPKSNILPTTTFPEVKKSEVLMFSSGSDTLSFADLAMAADNNTSGFGGGFGSGGNKGFAGAGKPLFSIPTNNENETVDNFESTAEFKPIVKLPSLVKLQSGEENEVVLFSHRAKLYRFDTSSKQWKERGIGYIKILQHKKTGKFRILMRRDQILKLCCNHLIVKGMALTARDEKSLQWITLSDFSEEESKSEQFTVRFKLAETASTFQRVFNDCLSSLDSGEGISSDSQESTTISSAVQVVTQWECQSCYVYNEQCVAKCIVCGSDRDPAVVSTSTSECIVTIAKEQPFITSVITTKEQPAVITVTASKEQSNIEEQPVITTKEQPTVITVTASKEQSNIEEQPVITTKEQPTVITVTASKEQSSIEEQPSVTTVTEVKQQPGVTTCSAAMSAALTFPSVTTTSTAPTTNPSIFVFGSSNTSQSKSSSPANFSFGSNTGSFNFSQSDPNIFGSAKLGAFNFTMNTTTSTMNSAMKTTSVPNFFSNTNVTFLQSFNKETDGGEADSQTEEWVTESESEHVGSEYNLEQSMDDDDDEELVGSSINNTLTGDADASITSVNTLVEQGDSSVTEQTHDNASGEAEEQSLLQ